MRPRSCQPTSEAALPVLFGIDRLGRFRGRQLVELAEGTVGDAKRVAEEQAVGDGPEQQHGDRRADDIGRARRHEAAKQLRHEEQGDLEQPRKPEQHDERGNGDGADLDRVRGVQKVEAHDGADRVLPFGRAPEEDERHDRAAADADELHRAQESGFRLRQFEVEPKPAQKEAQTIAGRRREARQRALGQMASGDQRRRQRRGEEQRPEQQSCQREGLEIVDRPSPQHEFRR